MLDLSLGGLKLVVFGRLVSEEPPRDYEGIIAVPPRFSTADPAWSIPYRFSL